MRDNLDLLLQSQKGLFKKSLKYTITLQDQMSSDKMARFLIGTLFEEEEIKEKTRFENMKAKDEKGHMRWEGAFTGGFTAGYKNTCGSKEGWAPSTFVSSRDKRAAVVQQDISAYMDEDDIGRGKLAQNIQLQDSFRKGGITGRTTDQSLMVNIVSVQQSIGERILNNVRKGKAEMNAPKDEEDIQKLFQHYAKQEELENTKNKSFGGGHSQSLWISRPKQDYKSLGFSSFGMPNQDGEGEDDDFIAEYSQIFNQLIRKKWKEETEDEKQKKKEENKVYFDFTRPEDQEQEYLKDIVEVEEEGVTVAKKKGRMYIDPKVFRHSLDEIFEKHERFKLNRNNQIRLPEVPADYNPYRKVEALVAQRQAAAGKTSHRNLSAQDRSRMLGQKKLPSSSILGSNFKNKFVKGETQQLGAVQELSYFLMDPKKQKRYDDFVLELEGKIIGGDSDLPWEEAQKEKEEFQRLYKQSKQKEVSQKTQSLELELKKQRQLEQQRVASKIDKIVRTKTPWRPSRLLCKRFGVLTPYTVDKTNDDDLL